MRVLARISLALAAQAGSAAALQSSSAQPRVRTRSWVQKWARGPAVALAATSSLLGSAAAIDNLPSGYKGVQKLTPEENQNRLVQILNDGKAFETAFQTFAAQHNKPYVSAVAGYFAAEDSATDTKTEQKKFGFQATPGMELEYFRRKEVFRANALRAVDMNAKTWNALNQSPNRAQFGVSKFSDLTAEEFKSTYLGMAVTEADKKLALMNNAAWKAGGGDEMVPQTKFLSSKAKMMPFGSKDWVEAGMTTDVKDQGQCGSCWAFSTVEQLESMARIEDETTSFVGSPQEVVSCDKGFGDEGCNGGLPIHAYKWLEGKALEEEADYPYMSGFTKMTGRCKADYSKGEFKVVSFKTISSEPSQEKDMAKYVTSEGPLSIGVDASAWQLYTGGVMTADVCEGEQLDHAVQITAYDGDSFDGAVWTVRNSWNTDWGEEGFIRLSAGEDTCLLTGMATTVDVEKVDAGKAVDEKKIETPGVKIEELDEDGDVNMIV